MYAAKQGETRVDLRHLLEDIRDSYPCPIDEAIVTELIANSLDSGASEIAFQTHLSGLTLICRDNGKGMPQQGLQEYHDIAATAKVKGKGIGFAGVGAKLALLAASAVITETKCRGFHGATRWHLESEYKAPWETIDPPGDVAYSTGTTVKLTVRGPHSDLLKPDFIREVVQTRYAPHLDKEFKEKILSAIYKAGVNFTVNGKIVVPKELEAGVQRKFFLPKLGKRGKPVGIGFLDKSPKDLAEGERGIAVSTFGKVIKRGWDWVGIMPRNPFELAGIVEIPALSEILTTNKADFLKDATSLQKFYRYRKAVQEAILPLLRDWGELPHRPERQQAGPSPLERELQRVLENMMDSYPELAPLLGRGGKNGKVTGVIPATDQPPVGTLVNGVDTMTGTVGGRGQGGGVEAAAGQGPGQRIEVSSEPTEKGQVHQGKRRRPGLMIDYDDKPEREELGWVTGDVVSINTAHPAWQRASRLGAENYHSVVAVAWALSEYLESEKSPQEFINRLVSGWARQ